MPRFEGRDGKPRQRPRHGIPVRNTQSLLVVLVVMIVAWHSFVFLSYVRMEPLESSHSKLAMRANLMQTVYNENTNKKTDSKNNDKKNDSKNRPMPADDDDDKNKNKNNNDSNEKNRNDQAIPPMLLVGGSDGSGTRAFVETLQQLGTVVVAEDRRTFDVHAGEIGQGWPGLIQRIFLPFGRKGFFGMMNDEPQLDKADPTPTVSSLVPNFDWPPEPPETSETNNVDVKIFRRDTEQVQGDIKRLLSSWNAKFQRAPRGQAYQKLMLKFKMKKMYPNAVATNTSFVVKAPVSMLALPAFCESYRLFRESRRQTPVPLKFLHVIRDGRDVALSDNQSPVFKFYNLTYPEPIRLHESLRPKFSAESSFANIDQMYAKAMRLWNDWNLVVHRWAMKHSTIRNHHDDAANTNTVSPVVDYLLVRSEDLLVQGSQKRLDALTAMAKFVGSSLTPEELCCLSRQGAKDHGESHIARSSADLAGKKKRGPKMPPHVHNAGQKRKPHVPPKPNMTPNQFRKEYDEWARNVEKANDTTAIHQLIRHGNHLLALQKKLTATSHNNVATLAMPSRAVLLEKVNKLKLKLGGGNTEGDTGHGRRLLGLTQRYGKWQKALENKTELSGFFHREGAEGLQVFGYHPYRSMDYSQQYGADPKPDNDHTKLGGTANRTSIFHDEEEGFDGEAPAICEVSVACPSANGPPIGFGTAK